MGCSLSTNEFSGSKLKKQIIKNYNEIFQLRKVLFQVVMLPQPHECFIISDIQFIYENSSEPKENLNLLLMMYIKNIEYRVKRLQELSKLIDINFNINKAQIQSLLSYYNITNGDFIQTTVVLSDESFSETNQI